MLCISIKKAGTTYAEPGHSLRRQRAQADRPENQALGDHIADTEPIRQLTPRSQYLCSFPSLKQRNLQGPTADNKKYYFNQQRFSN